MNESYDDESLDVTDSKQRQQAAEGVAERVCAEIVPCLFHDDEGIAWARLLVGSHYETYPVDSTDMRYYLKRRYWEEMKASCGKLEAMPKRLLIERLEILTSMALYDGEEKSVFLRGGEYPRALRRPMR